MTTELFGTMLAGSVDTVRPAREAFDRQAVDWDLSDSGVDFAPARQSTIAQPVSVAGPGTFLGKETRVLKFEPTDLEGWWFVRDDLADCLPVRVSVRNVWTTGDIVSNIVLRSGPPQNYIRMVEHIVALKCGLPVDNLMIRMESGDPPLLVRGSLDLVEALESAGRRESDRPVRYFTVKEKVTVAATNGSFLTFHPCTSSIFPPRSASNASSSSLIPATLNTDRKPAPTPRLSRCCTAARLANCSPMCATSATPRTTS